MKRRSIVAVFGAPGVLAGVIACGSFDAAPDDAKPSADAAAADVSEVLDSSAADGAAVDAACADCPSVFATSSREINWVALDAARVLWMDSLPQGGDLGDLRACPKGGCPAIGPATPFQMRNGAFLASDGNLAAFASISFGADVGVHRLNPDGTTTSVSGQATIHWLAVRDNTLYMTLYGGALERTVIATDATTNAVIGTCYLPGDGTINTDWTVVTDQRIFLGAHSTGGIFSCPKGGGDFTYFVQGTSDDRWVWSMATNDASIFWVDSVDRLVSCPASGETCNPTIVLTATNPSYAGGIRNIMHSNGDLFFETSGGDLVGCKASSCPNTLKKLAHETAFADSWRVSGANVVADANHIYYVARDGNPGAGATYRLMRLPRKPL